MASESKVAIKSVQKHFKEQHCWEDIDDRHRYNSSIDSEGKASSFFNNKSIMKDNDDYSVQYYNNCDEETNVSTKKINCQNEHRLQCQKFYVANVYSLPTLSFNTSGHSLLHRPVTVHSRRQLRLLSLMILS